MPTLGVNALKRHDEYYLRDGNVCFLVEGTIFRLHRHFFERESEYFREKLRPSSGSEEDGSPDSPYIISDVKVGEFAQLVWVWYNPYYSFSKKSKEHWLTIVKLATQWQFLEIKNLAIRQLEIMNLPPIEKIALYKEYKVNPDLLLPAYVSLARNEKLPSPAEGKKLTLDTVLKLANAREQILLSAIESGIKSPSTASVTDDVAKEIITKLFELTPHSKDQTVPPLEGQVVNNGDIANTETDMISEPPKREKKQLADLPQNSLFQSPGEWKPRTKPQRNH